MIETLITSEEGKPIQSILISQPKPDLKSPYTSLANKHNLQVDFRPFIEVQGVEVKEFRRSKINLLDFSAIIFTSRNAIKHFFRICEEARVKMPQDTKYFCTSQAIALFLQKFVEYRKRKVFFDKKGSSQGLKDLLKKHKKNQRFLLPCAENRKNDLPNFLKENNFNYEEALLYRTISSDLSDLEDITYDMIVFFSPLGIKSLFHNFPDFQQKATRIAAFGPTTSKAVEEYNLRLDVKAPAPGTPSMTMAIERYLKEIKRKVIS